METKEEYIFARLEIILLSISFRASFIRRTHEGEENEIL